MHESTVVGLFLDFFGETRMPVNLYEGDFKIPRMLRRLVLLVGGVALLIEVLFFVGVLKRDFGGGVLGGG